jgi:hypothetical protein
LYEGQYENDNNFGYEKITIVVDRKNLFLSIFMPVARMLQHVVQAYLANMSVLCYSLTIICCCQVQNYMIYWIISTENDHYVNPSWGCTLFRNNKQHVVLGQKRKCQHVEESGLWQIQREKIIYDNNFGYEKNMIVVDNMPLKVNILNLFWQNYLPLIKINDWNKLLFDVFEGLYPGMPTFCKIKKCCPFQLRGIKGSHNYNLIKIRLGWVLVFITTFSTFSAISWLPDLVRGQRP